MCGIVGYIGTKQAYPILVNGLKRLEYRGYDSAGVAMINDKGDLNVYKTKGKVADLEAFAQIRTLQVWWVSLTLVGQHMANHQA